MLPTTRLSLAQDNYNVQFTSKISFSELRGLYASCQESVGDPHALIRSAGRAWNRE
jgi:hypothetical protein